MHFLKVKLKSKILSIILKINNKSLIVYIFNFKFYIYIKYISNKTYYIYEIIIWGYIKLK